MSSTEVQFRQARFCTAAANSCCGFFTPLPNAVISLKHSSDTLGFGHWHLFRSQWFFSACPSQHRVASSCTVEALPAPSPDSAPAIYL